MKLFSLIVPVTLSVGLVSCGNLSKVSPDGTTENPVWPELQQSRFSGSKSSVGLWPNWDNVRLVKSGMTKEQLRYLIGIPHFNEGLFGVREWDYAFNYTQNGKDKVCQFKVLFDESGLAQSLYWKPRNCNLQYELADSLLFKFDSAELSEQGKEVINRIGAELRDSDADVIYITGYTDIIGSDAYNQSLSEKRAEVVKAQLLTMGLNENRLRAQGRGAADPIKVCQVEQNQIIGRSVRGIKAKLDKNVRQLVVGKQHSKLQKDIVNVLKIVNSDLTRPEEKARAKQQKAFETLKACLAPNRRVVISGG